MTRELVPCVYILASAQNGTLYTGVTSNLIARIYQHREGVTGGFTSRYKVWRLVHYEMHESMAVAIRREKTVKRWKREYKLNLIERDNPHWRDLAVGLGFDPLP
ncbi:MAG: GIY-YIG nuclease family protein [Pseudomonadota bacterium]